MAKAIGDKVSFWEYIKLGAGVGLGMMFINIVFLLIAMAFFIPGLLILANQRKKPVEKRNKSAIYSAYALMIIGSIFGIGLGAGFIFSSSMTDFGGEM